MLNVSVFEKQMQELLEPLKAGAPTFSAMKKLKSDFEDLIRRILREAPEFQLNDASILSETGAQNLPLLGVLSANIFTAQISEESLIAKLENESPLWIRLTNEQETHSLTIEDGGFQIRKLSDLKVISDNSFSSDGVRTDNRDFEELRRVFNEALVKNRKPLVFQADEFDAPSEPEKKSAPASDKPRFCKQCGSKRSVEAKFCEMCGAKFQVV